MKQSCRLFLLFSIALVLPFIGFSQCPGNQPFGLGPDTTVCSNGTLEITPGPDFATYLWQDGSTDEFFTVTDSGTYFVQAFDTNGCDYYDTIFVGLAFPTDIVLSPGDSSIVCAILDTTVFTVTNAGSFFSFLWDDSTTASSHAYTAPGVFFVIAINGDGCRDTVDILLYPAPSPVLDLSSPVYYCFGDSVLVDATDPGISSYLWSHGPTTATVNFGSNGLFGLEAIDSNGCVLYDTLSVLQYPNPPVDLGTGGAWCDDTTIVLDAGPGWVSQSWSNGATTQSITIVSTGNYFVQVTDTNGCITYSDTLSIVINGTPAPFDPELINDVLHAPEAAGYSYTWYENGVVIPGATGSTLSNLNQYSTYTVLLTTAEGCQMLSNAFYYEGNLDDIPEGFSPNADGINERFEIPGLDPYPDNRLVIYNRYGSEVFVAQPYQQNWEGKGPSGEPLPDGTYFYVLDLGNGSAPRNGYIMINR